MIDQIGKQIGNYRLTLHLGQGGFADVYLGEHVHIGRLAAVKVLHTQLTGNMINEFREEAKTLANLDHPNIVRVYEFGIENGTGAPYLAMSYASHGTLKQRYPVNPHLSSSSIIPYVKQVAAALQYVHGRKLVHRDIKPENILLGPNDEVLLGDFGIAVAAQLQNKQAAVGTVEYMSPEQIRGKAGPASDQYSLAIIVYEWLCGDLPFTGTTGEVVKQHLQDPPPAMSVKIPTISPYLEKAVLKALEKDPQNRFANIVAFANALEQASRQSLPPTIILPGSTPVSTNVLPKQTPVATTVLPGTICPPTVLVKQPVGTCLQTYNGHKNFVQTVAWSTNGLRIASGSDDRTVQIWDAITGYNVFIYSDRDRRAQVWTVAWSPDGKCIASGTARQVAQVWSATTGNIFVTYSNHIASSIGLRFVLAWSPSGKQIASGGTDTTVQVWDAATGDPLLTYRGHTAGVNAVSWSPDGTRISSSSNDRTVQVWDANTGNNAFIHHGHAKEVNVVAWSPLGKYIASASRDATVQVWDAVTDDRIFTYTGHERRIRSIAWSPDGKCIASVDDEKAIHIWDISTGTRIFTCEGHSGGVNALAWSRDGQFLASASSDNTVRVWQAK